MGKKIVLKKIEDSKKSQVTFSKRRANLIKKIREISIHCDVDVGFLAFSSAGRISKFCNRERIEDLIDYYVNLPVEKRLSYIKNIQEKMKRMQELGKIRNEEGISYYLHNQIENLELQVKIMEIEVQRIEADLRDFELQTEQEATFHQLSSCETNLKQAIEKVKEKKKEKLEMEKEQGISGLYNDDVNNLLFKGGSSSSNGQFQLWRNKEYIVPKCLFTEMLGKGKEKAADGDACVAFENYQSWKQASVSWPQVESNSSSFGYFTGKRSNLRTRDFVSAFNENSNHMTSTSDNASSCLEKPMQPKWDLNNIAVEDNEEVANNRNKENHDTYEIRVSPPPSVDQAPSSTSKGSVHLYDFFPSK